MAHLWRMVLVAVLFFIILNLSDPAWAEQIPRVTNIVILADPSPSMRKPHGPNGVTRALDANKS